MKKYRKKPVVIEAVQLTKDNASEIVMSFPVGKIGHEIFGMGHNFNQTGRLQIHTANGLVMVKVNDWVLVDPNTGDMWPVRDGIFEATYEEVSP